MPSRRSMCQHRLDAFVTPLGEFKSRAPCDRTPAFWHAICQLAGSLALQLQKAIWNLLRPVVHRVLCIAPLKRSRTLEAHAASALIDSLGQQITADRIGHL